MTGSMQLIREFCDCFIIPEKATRARIVIFLIFFFISTLPSYPLQYYVHVCICTKF